ncbi:unnamed protein product [Choristocarpus tenellus]
MGRINTGLQDRFPCVTMRIQAYLCCPCTGGLSLLLLHSQVKEVERGALCIYSDMDVYEAIDNKYKNMS